MSPAEHEPFYGSARKPLDVLAMRVVAVVQGAMLVSLVRLTVELRVVGGTGYYLNSSSDLKTSLIDLLNTVLGPKFKGRNKP